MIKIKKFLGETPPLGVRAQIILTIQEHKKEKSDRELRVIMVEVSRKKIRIFILLII
jgi:hypothetical protein